MPDTNNPAAAGTGGDAPIAPQDAMDALADILDDPETDNGENEATDAGDEGEAQALPTEPEDDSTDETSEGDSKAGPRDEAGRFVSPNAKVKLPDGSTTTVAELSQGHLRQSDYTQKTQVLAEERKSFEAERQRATEFTQHLQTQYAQVSHWLEQTKPQRPTVSAVEDPLAHLQYQEARERWDNNQQYWSQNFRQVVEADKKQRQTALELYTRKENEALVRVMPALRDPSKRDAFFTEAAKLYSDLGVTKEEIANLTDHRMLIILRDAVKGRRAQARAPEVRASLEGKPPIIRGSRRSTPASKDESANRQVTERLRKTGSVSDGIAALAAMKNL